MSDMGELFGGMAEASRVRRANNRQSSADLLRERGMEFDSKNDGAHLIVRHDGKIADFWPGTGKFTIRGSGTGRGVFNLLKKLGIKEKQP